MLPNTRSMTANPYVLAIFQRSILLILLLLAVLRGSILSILPALQLFRGDTADTVSAHNTLGFGILRISPALAVFRPLVLLILRVLTSLYPRLFPVYSEYEVHRKHLSAVSMNILIGFRRKQNTDAPTRGILSNPLPGSKHYSRGTEHWPDVIARYRSYCSGRQYFGVQHCLHSACFK